MAGSAPMSGAGCCRGGPGSDESWKQGVQYVGQRPPSEMRQGPQWAPSELTEEEWVELG